MKKRRLWNDLSVGIIYAVLTILMTWPLVLRLHSHFAGIDNDTWINPWATWWTGKAISEGQDLYYTNLMFYPRGVSLTFHSFSHVNTALELLLLPWLGRLAAHNWIIILTYVLSGYGMFCLVRYIAHDVRGAFFAGLVFTFFPYRMNESVHPVLVSTQWMPLYFLFLLRLLKTGRKRHVVPAALFFLLTALSSWHLMFLILFLSAVYLGYVLAFERGSWSRDTTRNLILLFGLIGITLAPFLYPIIREQLTVSRSYVGVQQSAGIGNDLVAFLLPAQEHPAWGKLVTPLYESIKIKRPVYLGLTVVGLTLIGSLADWRRARFWVLLALTSSLFSLGPYLQVNGHNLGILLPWSKPVVWLLRHPFRFSVLLGFALAVTSGLGLSAVLQRLAARRSTWGWSLAITMLLLFEYLSWPFPTTAAHVPDFYLDLAAKPVQGAILDLPMGRQPAKRYLYYQITHGWPLVEGVVSRTPTDAYGLINETPVLRSLRACGDWALPPTDLSSILNALAEQGIEYVILHKHLATPGAVDAWLNVRTSTPDYENEEITVYRTQGDTPPLVGQSQLLQDCVAVRSILAGPISVLQGETLDVPLQWTASRPPPSQYALGLALLDKRGTVVQFHQYQAIPAPLTDRGMRLQDRVDYPFLVDPFLPPGTYRLQATLVSDEKEMDSLLSAQLLDIQVSAWTRNYDPLPMDKSVDRIFAPDLRLLGYNLQVRDHAVRITLHWQALQRMETDYKFFVHLYEVESDTVAAQMDVMPHDWTYPTTQWEAEEIVSDEIVVSLEGVSPATYRLAVGVYDAVTGIRLLVRDAEGELAPLDKFVLQDEIQWSP